MLVAADRWKLDDSGDRFGKCLLGIRDCRVMDGDKIGKFLGPFFLTLGDGLFKVQLVFIELFLILEIGAEQSMVDLPV